MRDKKPADHIRNMGRIAIVTPAAAGARNGNRHTATRWAAMLRGAGRRVTISLAWDGAPADALIALHAKRSHESVARYREAHPGAPLVVALTGTDLYRDLPASPEARRSLELADRIIVLQEAALRELDAPLRRKARVAYQSSDCRLRQAPPGSIFRIAVIGHLREEKDPFRAVAALHGFLKKNIPGKERNIEIVHIGGALDPRLGAEAARWMQREPRYRWLDSLAHARTLGWLARSHLLVVSSVMEGGANVIAEAARIGTPVLASRVSGNMGMLGARYPGYFRLKDEAALGALIEKAILRKAFYARLQRSLRARRALFAPAAERAALLGCVREAEALRRGARAQ
jgi:putative glycosyltransferase (TIGR04348 family)